MRLGFHEGIMLTTAIFISAWEERGLDTAAEHEGMGPGLLAIEPRVLDRLLAYHEQQTRTGSLEPYKPIPWDSRCCPLCREVAFSAWHWSVRDHVWNRVLVGTRDLQVIGSEEGVDIQLIASLSPNQEVISSPFRSSALTGLVARLDAGATFLLATKDTVYMFEEFASFENLFRQHLEGNWGLAAEFCSIDEDELAMPEELP